MLVYKQLFTFFKALCSIYSHNFFFFVILQMAEWPNKLDCLSLEEPFQSNVMFAGKSERQAIRKRFIGTKCSSLYNHL
jgi:hypothetical protein